MICLILMCTGGEDMTATITDLDSKVADLEAENEALKEERLLLREKVKVSIIISFTSCRGTEL